MKSGVIKTAINTFACIAMAILLIPVSAHAAGTKATPTADSVQYYESTNDAGKTIKTGIKKCPPFWWKRGHRFSIKTVKRFECFDLDI